MTTVDTNIPGIKEPISIATESNVNKTINKQLAENDSQPIKSVFSEEFTAVDYDTSKNENMTELMDTEQESNSYNAMVNHNSLSSSLTIPDHNEKDTSEEFKIENTLDNAEINDANVELTNAIKNFNISDNPIVRE